MKSFGGDSSRFSETGNAVANATHPLGIKKAVTGQVKQLFGMHPTNQQPQGTDAMGDISKLLEQNNTQQSSSSSPIAQNPQTQQGIQEKYAKQNQHDQSRVKEIEREMEDIRKERERKWAEKNQQEEQEEEQEEMWKKEEEKKKNPVMNKQESGRTKG